MISLIDVTKTFNLGAEVTLTPIQNVTLKIEPAEFIMIIGRSGSGKSTMLNLIAGLVRPTSGQVLIEGEDIWNMTDRALSALRSRKLGFIFQFPSLIPALTILENVVMPTVFASHNNRRGNYERAAELLEMMGLSDKLQVYPKQLSAGEQKRVVIARSLINQPGILLADEPTSDLDAQTEQEIMGLLKEIHSRGVTILMVTHSLEIVPFATRVYRMEEGKLVSVADGTVSAIHPATKP